MNVRDYLIDHAGIDFQRLCANWRWCLSGSFTVWLINRFGDIFIRMDDASIWWLRLDDGSVSCVAKSKDEFCEKIDDAETASDWLMIPLVDRLVAAGQIPLEKQCYAFLQLPVLGGSYTVENIVIRDLEFHYAALGPVFEQLKNVPDGTPVTFKFQR